MDTFSYSTKKYIQGLIFFQKPPQISTTRKWIHFYLFWSKNVRKVPKMSYFMQFWPILGLYDPLRGPLYYQKSTFKSSYSPKSLHKFILPENLSLLSFVKWKLKKYAQKSYIWSFWPIFTPPNPQNGPYTTKEVHLGAHILPKVSIN